MEYTVQCMYTRRRMSRLRCQREFLTSFSSKSIKFLNYRVPMEAILLTGNFITGLNTTGIFSTDKEVLFSTALEGSHGRDQPAKKAPIIKMDVETYK